MASHFAFAEVLLTWGIVEEEDTEQLKITALSNTDVEDPLPGTASDDSNSCNSEVAIREPFVSDYLVNKFSVNRA